MAQFKSEDAKGLYVKAQEADKRYLTLKRLLEGKRREFFFSNSEEDKKIISREAGRLRRSLEEAVKSGFKPLVFMHYPPAYGNEACEEFINILNEFNIDRVYYGHIHGIGFNNSIPEYKGIKLKLVSCDCMNFVPFLIK
jgi:predicted phosphohydrolase